MIVFKKKHDGGATVPQFPTDNELRDMVNRFSTAVVIFQIQTLFHTKSDELLEENDLTKFSRKDRIINSLGFLKV